MAANGVDTPWSAVLDAMQKKSVRQMVSEDAHISRVTTVKLSDSLGHLFQVLADNRALAVCVVDDNNVYQGFGTMLALVNEVSRVSTQDDREVGLSDLIKEMLAEKKVSCITVRPPNREVHDLSLLHSFLNITKPGQKYLVHVDEASKLNYVLTQSMLVRWLYKHLHTFESLASMPVSEVQNLVPVVSVKVTDLAINAFHLMADKHLEGLAVVDAKGVLVDCISTSDLRGLNPNEPFYWLLYNSIKDFKKLVRKDAAQVPVNVVCLKGEATLMDLLHKMAVEKIHRVFVVHDDGTVRDIITQTDVLAFVRSKVLEFPGVAGEAHKE